MTFMPNFVQPSEALASTVHINLESELLAERSREGLAQLLLKLGGTVRKSAYQSRLESELQIIQKKQVSSYFLIVADYVNWAKDNGIAVGPGRGSGPCSLVGLALGITKIDPIKYGLPFERFLNPERDSLPDFDLDFCDERRGEVTSYIQSRYGADRVAQISSVDNVPLASRLIIADRPLSELVPLHAGNESAVASARITLAQMADAGLVQFNVINQKALTLIQRVVKALAGKNVVVDIDNIPLDDHRSYQLLCRGEVSRTDEMDGSVYKAALLSVQPQHFAELAATIALWFAQQDSHTTEYVTRKSNPEESSAIHPIIEEITKETYGMVIYQEQVMRIAHKVAGYTWGQGDMLRRVLKNQDTHAIGVQKKKFINGAIGFGLPPTEAVQLFEKIESAAHLYFNKSHAVAYAMIAYQVAWLKANYATEFESVASRL